MERKRGIEEIAWQIAELSFAFLFVISARNSHMLTSTSSTAKQSRNSQILAPIASAGYCLLLLWNTIDSTGQQIIVTSSLSTDLKFMFLVIDKMPHEREWSRKMLKIPLYFLDHFRIPLTVGSENFKVVHSEHRRGFHGSLVASALYMEEMLKRPNETQTNVRSTRSA